MQIKQVKAAQMQVVLPAALGMMISAGLNIDNIFDAKWKETQFLTQSRQDGEPIRYRKFILRQEPLLMHG